MPWTLNDYPSSMKNLDKVVRKKAIDIANSMVDEGYEEGRAIPIATQQAKEWYQNADKEEIKAYEKAGKPTERSKEGKRYENNPERLNEGEHVIAHEEGWAVTSSKAKKPSAVFATKDEAVNRAKEIAQNKGTALTVHKQDGSVQATYSY
ncbi:hypothetical protein GCM10011409_22760 [Lentibacillus populi]|uniref:DUF2188 domain-containing protein n=1 Tax=Lentibacillus populi TaxID=1827502 RepID=A0A9W5X650_9BACI|nr:DUF2188 domain-containing protein [Lentibacillus populi]GGB44604.1 hypothetical protein GCM10011409_22760 [Lentibacillus populi]